MDLSSIFSIIFTGFFTVCLLFNFGFSRPHFFSFFNNLQLKAISSFLSLCSLLLSIQNSALVPILGDSGRVVRIDAIETMCHKCKSNSSFPTAWLEKTPETFYPNDGRFEIYLICIILIIYAEYIVGGCLKCLEPIQELISIIPLATSTVLPDEDEKERIKAVVQVMLNKVGNLTYEVNGLVIIESLYLCICPMYFPLILLQKKNSPPTSIRFNGFEWTVVCGRQTTYQDEYTLESCETRPPRPNITSLCIVSNINILNYMTLVSWFFLHLWVLLCLLGILVPIYEIYMLRIYRSGHRRIIRFLKQNVDYSRHKAIIDLFDMKLEEISIKMTKEEIAKKMQTGVKAGEGILTENLDQIVGSNNLDTEVVPTVVAISIPD